jgi:hypothetical protein
MPSSDPSGQTHKEIQFNVQFNPSELVINARREIEKIIDTQDSSSASGSGRSASSAGSGGGSNLTQVQEVKPPGIFLTLKLIFDEVNISDAFMSDKFTITPTAVAKSAITQGLKATGKSEWSVKPIVEAFIGAMRNDKTRLIRFNWAEFAFTGTLMNLDATYVMFSPSGNPIRANVILRLKNDLTEDEAEWKKWFNMYFSDNILGNLNKTSMANRNDVAGNLLNMSW